MVETCHVDKSRRGGETFQAEIMVQRLWEHCFWDTCSDLLLLDIKRGARGKYLGFTLYPVASSEHKSGMIGPAYFKGYFGSSEEDRLKRVSGHEEYQEEADTINR